jgi:hypothetical protein
MCAGCSGHLCQKYASSGTVVSIINTAKQIINVQGIFVLEDAVVEEQRMPAQRLPMGVSISSATMPVLWIG